MGCFWYGKYSRHNSSVTIHPSNLAEVFIRLNFQPAYRDPGRENRDLWNRARPPSHVKPSKIFTKDLKVRRDVGNRASYCRSRAHVKRHLDKKKITSGTQGSSVTKTWFYVVSHIKPTVFLPVLLGWRRRGKRPGDKTGRNICLLCQIPCVQMSP